MSYVGVPLSDKDGAVFGALCALGHQPHTSLNSRDLDTLVGLAEVVATLVRALDEPPAPPSPTGLAALAVAVEDADDVGRLSRPLLDALRDLTGLASTYLTVVHEDDGLQEVRYARNTQTDFEIPEGVFVPWEDTLCKRSLDEGRPVTTDVPAVRGDSVAARALGIQVYASVPVATSDGRVWGTLCGADPMEADDVATHLPTMRLFARLIGAQVEREGGRAAGAGRGRHRRAHALLLPPGRPQDLVARLGGDEFLVAARVPRDSAGPFAQRVRDALTFSLPWLGASIDVRASVGVAVSEGHDGPSLVAVADAAMYAAKRHD